MSTRNRSGRSRGTPGSRYERRARARSRRVRKRLERARQERVTRARRQRLGKAAGGDPGRQRARTRVLLALLFATPLLIGASLTPTLAAEALGWWSGQTPRLRAISVQGHRRLSALEIAEATGLARAATLDGLRLDGLEERLAKHPWIRSARVALLPTGTLIVDVEEREARAVVRGTADETAHFLDEHCVPFAPVEAPLPTDPPLPTLRTPTAREPGRADGELCRALALAESVRDLARPDASAILGRYARSEVILPAPGSELGWMLQAPSGEAVILGDGPGELMSGRLANLERLLDSGLDAVEQASTIDLRFADQAVLRGFEAPDGAQEGGG